ncbi:MAG TPA: hypothetical protein VLL25_09985 [Acidimicrobiales bacterium]|nr:hypothetical protein [Acidimicrobiales bacterium]
MHLVPVIAFIAHDIAGWIGVPTAAVIVGMIMLRRRGKQRLARRKQAHDSSTASLPPRMS